MRALLAIALAVLPASPAWAGLGPDHVTSDRVEFVANVRLPGSGQGGSIHGDRLYVTSPSHLSIFEIADPAAPALLGATPIEAVNESEAVATNGRIAAVAGPTGVSIYDVSAPPLIPRLATMDIAAQSAACVADCRYLWVTGADAIVDLADPGNPTVVGSFLDAVPEDTLDLGCFAARELRPGLVIMSCDPILLLSTEAALGGTPERPVLVATGNAPAFDFFLAGAPHSAHWPQGGRDALMLSSTETPFHAECESGIGALVTWDARGVRDRTSDRFRTLDQWRPANGTYVDGRSPYNAVGCSPHFLAEHPSFRDGGLVAQAALENGMRLLWIAPDGAIEERDWFLGLGGTAAIPIWHPDGRTLYVVDYVRGLDVLRYTGDFYVPATPTPATAPPATPRFRLAGVTVRRGRARLAVEVPGAGRVAAAGRAGRLRLRRSSVRAVQGGLVTLTVGAHGRAARVLRRRGRLRVRVVVTFQPADGRAQRLRTRVTLRRGA